ncbi:MAG: peptidylprolyl isomerase [Acidimicrobiia bacterium]|nr:peptidylprolyl isomerase [Acidimicrobiia bacterium]
MRMSKILLYLGLISLLATACSSSSEEDIATATTQSEAVDTPDSSSTAGMLTQTQQELADAMFLVLLNNEMGSDALAEDGLQCLANKIAETFSDNRLNELGLNPDSMTAAYETRGDFALGEEFAISEAEISTIVDSSINCLDWRDVLESTIAADGTPPQIATCIASETSDESIRTVAENILIAETDETFGLSAEETTTTFQACVDIRTLLQEEYVQQGLSQASAQCVAEGIPDEMIDLMLNNEEAEEEEMRELVRELEALQNRCLTPEEIALLNDAATSSDVDPSETSSTETDSSDFGSSDLNDTGDFESEHFESGPWDSCPPIDGSGPVILEFLDPQPLCLDPTLQYTAVFDTTAGEIRVALDMVNTPITANNFAVLALHHYYDNTLLFRTDPGIGIIQGGAPHTNSPADPGPGYSIIDEGSNFTYEPGQIVMARTSAPNSASAQFFFTVNENAALLNSQGTYVVFGQMDDASLVVAEAILASHVAEPGNPLGGSPEPAVTVKSVTISETG